MGEEAFPSDWSLEDFPHPNPYFPRAPRNEGVWKWWAFVALLATFIGTVATGFALPSERTHLFLVCEFSGFISLSLALWLAKGALAIRVWRNARIVPARVIREPEEGANPPLDVSPIGILAEAFFTFIYSPGEVSAKLEFVQDGKLKIVRMKPWGQDYRLLEGDITWIVLHGPPGRAVSVDRVAPDEYFGLPVPTEVRRWLSAALLKVGSPDPASLRDQHRAAEASRQAFVRARMGKN